MTYDLTRPVRLDIDGFARLTGLHPDLVHRFVALGLIDATRDATGALWFAADQVPKVARLQRLRAGLALNYAALGLVADLLDRIAQLEARQRRPADPTSTAPPPTTGARRWT
ncbi:MAG: MerR family transcriptional regulator [Acidimicrobiia bacterium]|nr:MerR family transcriptional regulator [Acidimicrobiia bacterium]